MEKKTTTDKGIKNGYTRHTLALKKEHLKLLQALSLYSNKTITDITNELLDKAFSSVDKKTITKALTLYAEIKEPTDKKTKSLFKW